MWSNATSIANGAPTGTLPSLQLLDSSASQTRWVTLYQMSFFEEIEGKCQDQTLEQLVEELSYL